MLTWELAQRRYFDTDFGGAIVPGQRTVLTTGLQLTAYSFFDRPRNYSPVVSAIRFTPRPGFGIEARSDYDPLRGKIVNNSLSADVRAGQYFFSVGHNAVACMPLAGVETRNIDRQQLCASPPQPLAYLERLYPESGPLPGVQPGGPSGPSRNTITLGKEPTGGSGTMQVRRP